MDSKDGQSSPKPAPAPGTKAAWRQQLIAKTRGFVLQEHALSLYANCTKTDCEHRQKSGTR